MGPTSHSSAKDCLKWDGGAGESNLPRPKEGRAWFGTAAPGPGSAAVPESLSAGSPDVREGICGAGEKPALPLRSCVFPRIPAGDGHHWAQRWAAQGTPWEAALSVILMKFQAVSQPIPATEHHLPPALQIPWCATGSG